ncbi:hypothetical protein [Streptomyces sp. NPDC026673]|uniref:hypothetical protein n=1 Tax=Streptomyces sp. NPDC026673 TaxID=3155724 RepID=UPI0033DEDB8F
MTTPNTALADILDHREPDRDSERLLAALVDFGVFVPVKDDGSVLFIGWEGDTGPVLPGYVSEECCRRNLPDAAAAVHCDIMRLLDIVHHTKVDTLAVFSEQGSAKLPFALVAHTLRVRGMRTTEERTVRFTWSTHPTAVALRDAIRLRLLDFPGVRCVWIAQARWTDTGMEQLLLQIALTDTGTPDAARRLIDAVLSGTHLGDGDRELSVRVLSPASEEDMAAMRELDTFGLDTVRADHAARRVEVISREYDNAPAPAPAPPRRWWRR